MAEERTINVTWDSFYGPDTLGTSVETVMPRIGEHVHFEKVRYVVHDVEWHTTVGEPISYARVVLVRDRR